MAQVLLRSLSRLSRQTSLPPFVRRERLEACAVSAPRSFHRAKESATSLDGCHTTQYRSHLPLLAACLASFGAGTLLTSNARHNDEGHNHGSSPLQGACPLQLASCSFGWLPTCSSTKGQTHQSSAFDLNPATCSLSRTSFAPHTTPSIRAEQHHASSMPTSPPQSLGLSPVSVQAPIPDYLRSQEPAKALPAPAEADPTASTRPYLKANFISDAAAKAAPAVVNITVSFGKGWLMGQSAGSGFIVDKDGSILTNAHVVAEVSNRGPYSGKILVTMPDGRTFEGKVVSFDTLADIAVVKVDSKDPLPSVKLGESGNLRAGDWVVALGSPFHLMNTVTCGIVSCTHRKSSEIGLLGGRTDYIQTDAAINQGNSGGPLVGLDGKVIGINTMKALTGDGVSFAIPIDAARKVVDQLAKHGRVLRPFVGMKMLELNEAVIGQLRERDPSFPDVSGGVLVPQVVPGSPAEKGGLMSGDVIVEFDGQSITTVRQILDALGDRIGERFKVVVQRPRNKTATLYVTTEEAGPQSF